MDNRTTNRTRRGRRGFSLAEVMVGCVMIALVIMMSVKVFRSASLSLKATSTLTTANTLAQIQLSFLKDQSFKFLQVTTNSIPIPGLTPPQPYDMISYPPQTIIEGPTTFTRYSFVERVARSGGSETLTSLPASNQDSGLKRATVIVVWQERGELRHVTAITLKEAFSSDLLMLVIQGTVTTPSGVPIVGVTVMASGSDSRAWGVTSVTGTYRLSVGPGARTVQAMAPGYESVLSTCVLTTANSPLGINFALSPRLRVPVEGVLWYNDHPVISRVAAGVDNGGFVQEYVELFNPTTWTWTVSGQLGLKFQRTPQDAVALPIDLSYITGSVGPGRFYLFANAGAVTVSGVTRNADAVWGAGNGSFPYFGVQNNIIPINTDGAGEGSGGVELFRVSNGTALDRFGWRSTAGPPQGIYEGTPFVDPLGIGAELDNIFQRFSSTSGVSLTNGPAYDSGNNNVEWASASGAFAPRSTADGSQTVVAGVPAVGGWFATNNPFGMAIQAVSKGSPPYASAMLSVTTTPFSITAFLNQSSSDPTTGRPWFTPPNEGMVVNTLLDKNSSIWGTDNLTTLVGRLVNSIGTPLQHIPVGSEGFLSREDGTYALITRVSAPLPYMLYYPWVNEYGNVNRRYESFQGGTALPPILAVVGGTTVGGDIALKGLSTVTGKILNEDGSPVIGQRVDVSGTAKVINNGSTDTDGIFRITVKEGTGTLNFFSTTINILPTAFLFTVNFSNVGLDIDAGTFIAYKYSGSLSGVLKENGNPYRNGATVIALRTPNFQVLTSTMAPPAPSSSFFATAFQMTQSLPDGSFRIGFDQLYTTSTFNVYSYRTSLEDGTLVTRRANLSNVVIFPYKETVADIQW